MTKQFENSLDKTPKKNRIILCVLAVCLILLSGILIVSGHSKKEETVREETNAQGKDDNVSLGESSLNAENYSEAEAVESAESVDFSKSEHMAYISNVSEKSIIVDFIEWVLVPSSRAEELGITDNDAPGGFYVYNQETLTVEYSFSPDCRITVLNWQDSYRPMEISISEFRVLLEERGEQNEFIPYILSLENGRITEVEEQYVP